MPEGGGGAVPAPEGYASERGGGHGAALHGAPAPCRVPPGHPDPRPLAAPPAHRPVRHAAARLPGRPPCTAGGAAGPRARCSGSGAAPVQCCRYPAYRCHRAPGEWWQWGPGPQLCSHTLGPPSTTRGTSRGRQPAACNRGWRHASSVHPLEPAHPLSLGAGRRHGCCTHAAGAHAGAEHDASTAALNTTSVCGVPRGTFWQEAYGTGV
mmetsp:Transcript_30367/g.67354  ORF Transcript_30367/g.67354 Transcript_30367/m.67354 type:complete len:209 (+) Transcript_30367:153-779(+)